MKIMQGKAFPNEETREISHALFDGYDVSSILKNCFFIVRVDNDKIIIEPIKETKEYLDSIYCDSEEWSEHIRVQIEDSGADTLIAPPEFSNPERGWLADECYIEFESLGEK